MEKTREADRAKKMEVEANRFAARILMPPTRIRANLKSRQPDLAEVVRLADEFDVSKAAMARSYLDAHREALALVVVRDGRIEQVHRPDDFPWIGPSIGQVIPEESIACGHHFHPGQASALEECDPETWLSSTAARSVDILSEQVLAQRDGWAMILLHAEGTEAE